MPKRDALREGEDEASPSGSTISTKASLVAPVPEGGERFFGKDHPPTPNMKPKRPVHVKKSREELNINTKSTELQQDNRRRKLSDVSSDTHASNTAQPPNHRPDSDTQSPTSNLEILSDYAASASASALSSEGALDGRVMVSSSPLEGGHHSSDHQSHHSANSLELGTVPSWEHPGRPPMQGWSVSSSMAGMIDSKDQGALSPFSFSDTLRTDQGRDCGSVAVGHAAGGRGNGDHVGEDDDSSPKSILSKGGEKRKNLAPGTHVQFSREAAMAAESTSSYSATRKRSHHEMMTLRRSSMAHQQPFPPQDDYYFGYPRQQHPAAPQGYPYGSYQPHNRSGGPMSPPSSSGHYPPPRETHYPEEDSYYDNYYSHPHGGTPPLPYGYSPHAGGDGRYPLPSHCPPPVHHHPEEYRASHDGHVPPYPRDAPSRRRGHPGPNTVHIPPSSHSSHYHHFPPVTTIYHPHISSGDGGHMQYPNPRHQSHHGGGAISSGSHQQFSHLRGSSGPNACLWTKDDDDALMEIMKKHKSPKKWVLIAEKLSRDKSPRECEERWLRFLKPGSRKGQWTEEEDLVVLEAVRNSTEEIFTRWSDLAQQLPGRVGKQVRDRWVNHLNPAINHLPFSREDDLLLWDAHHLLGKRWVEISSRYFKGTRAENHIKNRWYSASFKRFIAKQFGPDAYRIGNGGGSTG